MPYLIGSFLLFVLLLLVLILYVFKRSKRQSNKADEQPKNKNELTLDAMIKILKTEKKELSKIEGIVEKMAKNFPFPENDREANKHFEFVYFYAKNPLSTAKMIVQMQKILTEANPKYAKQIEDFQMRGVDARAK